jgi:hypothetical protein
VTDISKLKEGDTFIPKSWDDAHPGRFLKHADVTLAGGELTLTVTKVHAEHMGAKKDGSPDTRNILSFKEIPKQYATQKTNERLIVAMFGPRPEDFIGKRVTFVVGQDFNISEGKNGPCVRVGGSPDISETMQVTVTYSRKTRRAPKEFTLRKTVVAGVAGLGPDAVRQAVTAIQNAAPDAIEGLKAVLSEKAWSKAEKAEIRKAFEERAGK